MVNPNSIVQAIPNNLIPPSIIHQDNSAFPTSIILYETNYPLRSQLMEMRIGARNKSRYLARATKKRILEDSTFAIWITENQRVKWLIDSVSPLLIQRFIRLSTVI